MDLIIYIYSAYKNTALFMFSEFRLKFKSQQSLDMIIKNFASI